MKVEEFRLYLQEKYVGKNGSRISKKAAGDCISRCRRVESIIGKDLDEIIKKNTPEGIKSLLKARIDQSEGSRLLNDLHSATLRYDEFRRVG